MPQYIDKFNLLASNKERKERTDTCSSCEHQVMKWGVAWCQECGCHIEGKSFLKASECPLNKWAKL